MANKNKNKIYLDDEIGQFMPIQCKLRLQAWPLRAPKYWIIFKSMIGYGKNIWNFFRGDHTEEQEGNDLLSHFTPDRKENLAVLYKIKKKRNLLYHPFECVIFQVDSTVFY